MRAWWAGRLNVALSTPAHDPAEMHEDSAPIIVLDPDAAEGRMIAGWLRSAGLGKIAVARTGDEALFLLGRSNADLLILDEHVPAQAETRLLRHIAACGHDPPPAILRVVTGDSQAPPAPGRAVAVEHAQKPLTATDMVLRVGSALQRPDLVGRMDRARDQAAANLAAARRMQLALLPTPAQLGALQAECGVGLDGFCHSGEEVGGDFWGAWPTGEGCFALALADFAGHGLSAAMNTFRLHAILSENTLPRGAPLQMTSILNTRLNGLLTRGHYATMVYAQIDPRRRQIAWCSAGGPSPMFVTREGRFDLKSRGLPLGVKPASAYTECRASLAVPGLLCLFSDGLFEGGPDAADIGREEIGAVLSGAASLAASGRLAEATRRAMADLAALRERHSSFDHSDDVMAVCVALGPPSSPPPA